MESFIDADLVTATPEDFFFEFTRGFVHILRQYGAAPALAAFAGPVKVLQCDPQQLLLYSCEMMRMRVLDDDTLRPLLRALADPLVVSTESGGHLGWQRRLAALAAQPLAAGEEAGVYGLSLTDLTAVARGDCPFQFRPGGLGYDWERLFCGLVQAYGPDSPARELTGSIEWMPAWLTLSAKTDLHDHLWPWVDRALLILCALVRAARGEAQPLEFLTRPQVSGNQIIAGGVLMQLTPTNTQELELTGAWVAGVEDFPQFSGQFSAEIVE